MLYFPIGTIIMCGFQLSHKKELILFLVIYQEWIPKPQQILFIWEQLLFYFCYLFKSQLLFSSTPCGSTSDSREFITWDNLHLGLQPLSCNKFLAPVPGNCFGKQTCWGFLSLRKLHKSGILFPLYLTFYFSCIIYLLAGFIIPPTY